MSRVLISLVGALLVILCGAGRVEAQQRSICFPASITTLSSDDLITIRGIGAEMVPGDRRWPHIVLRGPVESRNATDSARVDEILLELMRVGVGVGRVKQERLGPPNQSGCFTLEVVSEGPHYMALWHFWGPYFDLGEADIPLAQRRRMRFIVADYVPGVTIYRIEGHSDTLGSREASMRASRRRAENVARELIRQGVREDDITIQAFGETRLARATPDGTAEPLNRRVYIDVRSRPQSPVR